MDTISTAALVLVLVSLAYTAWWLYRRRQTDRALERRRANQRQAAVARSAETIADLTTQQVRPGTPVDELMRQLCASALGLSEAGTEMDAMGVGSREVEASAREQIRRLGAEPRQLPRRPQLLPQLMQAVNDDDASMREIARIIAQDPALTGNLLRIANSAAYRINPEPIDSIERAIAVLGTHGVRSTIAAAVMQPVLSSGGAFGRLPEVIWDHSMRAASAAEAHAVLIGNDDPFAAQLAALLHGLGAITVFRIVRDEFADQPLARPSITVVARLIEENAATVAAEIATAWELSDRVIGALSGQVAASQGREAGPLASALVFGRCAGALALLLEAGRLNADQGRHQLGATSRDVAQVDRIWERMVKAAALAPRAQGDTTARRRPVSAVDRPPLNT
jgi:HD-like signal output (HDOD) protein